jgi:signal transduction histidine kinase
VVALKVRLGIARTIAEREGADSIVGRITSLAENAQHAVDAMRIVARGIYPPLLDAEGLGRALATVERAAGLTVDIDLGSLPRYQKAIEETIYFCVLAAVTGAKAVGASIAQLKVQGDDSALTVTIGYDAAGHGDLTDLTDRTDAFGGTVTASTSAERTTIELTLPVGDEALRIS